MVDGSGHVERIEEKYAVESGGTLTVDADLGSIHVEPWSRNEVEVFVEKRIRMVDNGRVRQELEEVEVEIMQHRNGVRVEIDRPGWFRNNRVSVKVKVRVPQTYNLELKTSGGDIETGDINGDINARTAGGDVDIGTVSEGDVTAGTAGGDVRVRGGGRETALSTAGGNITVDRADGGVTAKTTGGNIEIGDTNGDVDAKTTGGNIEIGRVQGNVTAGTVGGNIEIGPILGDVDVKTIGGSIDIDDVGGKVNSSALGGRVTVGSS
ncbi:MAG: hypothetical protein OXU79_07365 [Gemmatimonadota bacterium]|nr:hypothetical protein [Gemmatimonadota bacterium]